jgi:choline dehydrogenase
MNPGDSIGSWDVLVVGAGSAGCALAHRLSTIGNRQVLLMEAGPDFPPGVGWPRAVTHGRGLEVAEYLTVFDAFYTAKQPLSFVFRGRIVGGSGAVNGGVFFRGVAEDYDSWGSHLWSYDSVLPTFQAMERDLDFGDDPFHGSDGPVPVKRTALNELIPHQAAFYEAALRSGFATKDDLAATVGEGVGPIPMNIDPATGARISPAMAYIDPIRDRPTLTLCSDTKVLKVLFDHETARGVLASRDGRLFTAMADEVILCAGALISPQLLIHSGIGPEQTLRRLSIPVRVSLPGVGQNVRDHPLISVKVMPRKTYPMGSGDPAFQTQLVMTCGSGTTRNDMHIVPSFGFDDSIEYKAILQQGVAAGRLEFESPDPEVRPRIHFQYLEPRVDRERMIEGLETILDLLRQPSLMKVVEQTIEPTGEDLSSRSAIDRWIDGDLGSCKHTCGTCRMGSSADATAVVDFEGRVHGVHNLRVADLSIAPNIVRAPTHATAIMIGDQIARLVLSNS